MKKTILFFGIVAGIFTANAQKVNTTKGPASGDVTLKVNLFPLQSIVINPSSKVVNLNYKTAANYLDGVNRTEVDHLTVFSTGAFDVNVKTTNPTTFLTSDTEGSTAIPVDDIKILVTGGTTVGNTPLLFNGLGAVSLSATDQLIGESASAGSGNINVNYKAAGANSYLSRVVGGEKTTYTANLTYSIIAK